MSGLISRVFRAAQGTFQAWGWGTDGGPSMPLVKLAHDGNDVVREGSPLPTVDTAILNHLTGRAARVKSLVGVQAKLVRANNMTAYDVSDAVAGDAANSWLLTLDVSALGAGPVWLTRLRLDRNTVANFNAQFRAWVFSRQVAQPADNAPFSLAYAGVDAVRGYVDFTAPLDVTGPAATCTELPGMLRPSAGILIQPTGGKVYLGVTVLAAYVPTTAADEFLFSADVQAAE